MHHENMQLVSHDGICVVLHAIHGGWFLGAVNLHGFISFTFTLTFALLFLLGFILASAAFGLEILATIVRLLGGRVSTSHFRVINHSIGVDGGIIGTLSELSLLLLEFLCTV
jgi:hypothetical protein